jgi:hypothetical protein
LLAPSISDVILPYMGTGTMAQKERLPGAGVERAMKRTRDADYWCLPQTGGHPVLYFRGHRLISRADYIAAVGAADCDPHVGTGRRSTAVKRSSVKRSSKRTGKTPGLRSLGDAGKIGARRRKRSRAKLRSTGDTRPVR